MKSNKLFHAYETIAHSGLHGLSNALLANLSVKMMPHKAWNYPKFAQIEITSLCNLRCEMCPISHKDYVQFGGSKNMKLVEFQSIIDQLPFLELALLQGLGEPLLNPALIQMIRYASSRGIRVTFFTNATLMVPETSQALVFSGLSKLIVSIDGGIPETYERIRPGANFSQVVENVGKMVQIKSKLGKDTPLITFMVVGMKENVREIPQIIELAHSLGVSHVDVINMHKKQGLWGTVLTENDLQFLREYCVAVAHKMGIQFSYPHSTVLRSHSLRMSCRWPWTSTYITANGFVIPCCNSFDRTLNFGNIFETEFRQIWNNEAFADFRFQLKTAKPDICVRCPHWGSS